MGVVQGCQKSYFQTKNPNLVKYLEGLTTEDVCIFYAIWSILMQFSLFLIPFGLFYIMPFWYISWLFGIFFPFSYEKFGNPGVVVANIRMTNTYIPRRHRKKAPNAKEK
jgi:hypothetical protein